MDKFQPGKIDFSSVLASTVHDMKNSLCMLIQSIDTLSATQKQTPDSEQADALAMLHYEASRLNTNLLQMLSLYRAEKDQLPLMIEEHYLEDIVDELIEKNTFYSENRKITIETQISPDLRWYLDDNLIGNLLNDIFVNALRYTQDKIRLVATIVNNQLEVSIQDNGKGYPEHMLSFEDEMMADLDLNASRTGLGLFFARLIANAHSNQNKSGYIKLSNDCDLGGSVFTLVLP
jgi:K+-sensing histidine kinase KdpD